MRTSRRIDVQTLRQWNGEFENDQSSVGSKRVRSDPRSQLATALETERPPQFSADLPAEKRTRQSSGRALPQSAARNLGID
jgi:hypothetical protein